MQDPFARAPLNLDDQRLQASQLVALHGTADELEFVFTNALRNEFPIALLAVLLRGAEG